MKLGKLSLKNFLSFDVAEVDLSNIRKGLILGMNNKDASDSNGSGKTSLFEAIGWAAWGESKAESIDLNVKDDRDSCLVSHEFEHDGKIVKITRGRNKKTSQTTLDFIIDGVVSNGSTVTDTNSKISEFLNLDYDTFVNSVYIRQDDVQSLANTNKPNEGRELLEKALNLDEYEPYWESAKDEHKLAVEKRDASAIIIAEEDSILSASKLESDSIKQHENTISELEIVLKTWKGEIVKLRLKSDSTKEKMLKVEMLQVSIEKAEKDIEVLAGELDGLRKNAIAYKDSLDGKKTDLEIKIAQEEVIKNGEKAINEKEAKSKIAEDKDTELKAELEEIRSRNFKAGSNSAMITGSLKGLSGKFEDVKDELETAKRRVENPSIEPGEKCEHCYADLTEHSVENYVEHFKEKIKTLQASYDEIKSQIDSKIAEQEQDGKTMDTTGKEIDIKRLEISENSKGILSKASFKSERDAIASRLADIVTYKTELDNINSGAELENWKKMVQDKKKSLEDKTIEKDNLKIEFGKIDIDHEMAKKVIEDIAIAEGRVDGTNRNITISKTSIDTLKANVKNLDEKLALIDREKELIKNLEEVVQAYSDLVMAFSSQGIRSYVLENAIAELEVEANEILSRLSSGRLQLEFRTKKEIKKSKSDKHEKMTFDVFINNGRSTLPFKQHSGGEKFRISFVLRVALSKLLLRRSKSKLEFLIIDEAVSPLDGTGVEKIMEIINSLQEDFKTILVITHRADVKSYFDEVITIEKDENGSRIAA
jgi:exonuclease SbcC